MALAVFVTLRPTTKKPGPYYYVTCLVECHALVSSPAMGLVRVTSMGNVRGGFMGPPPYTSIR